MTPQQQRLAARGPAARAAGHWRDETLRDHLARAVAATPERTAIVARRSEGGQERRITYRALDALATRVALSLREHGVGPGDVVSFQLPNWWEFPVLHLACLKLAHAYEQAMRAGKAVTTVDGQMIEALHYAAAKQVLIDNKKQ